MGDLPPLAYAASPFDGDTQMSVVTIIRLWENSVPSFPYII